MTVDSILLLIGLLMALTIGAMIFGLSRFGGLLIVLIGIAVVMVTAAILATGATLPEEEAVVNVDAPGPL